MMQYILHADDFGLSHGINKSIISAIENGFISSISLIINGYAVDEAIAYLLGKPEIRVSLHFNLQEGTPAAKTDEVGLLLNKRKQLDASFQRLCYLWATGSQKSRETLFRQVSTEFREQIQAYKKKLEDRLDVIRVDSHSHIHAIPFIRDAILSCHNSNPIDYVRAPREPGFLTAEGEWWRPFGLNAVKHFTLNYLSGDLRKRLAEKGILHNEYVVGVLYTGLVRKPSLLAGLAACEKRNSAAAHPRPQIVEVLLHPGQAAPDEQPLWEGRRDLWEYYSSNHRRAEHDLCLDQDIGEALNQLNNGSRQSVENANLRTPA